MNEIVNVPVEVIKADARLPETYANAKTALAKCARIDECKKWSDKAAALASYARMSDDHTLHKLAIRIQARAIRRTGQLLKTYQTGPKGGRPKKNGVGDHPVSKKEAAEQVGMSEHQRKTAVSVANISKEEFEEAIESEKPPTMTKLAAQGKKSQGENPKKVEHEPVPEGFKPATTLLGSVDRFAEFCSENEPTLVAGGVLKHEIEKVRKQIATIDSWLDRFVVNLH